MKKNSVYRRIKNFALSNYWRFSKGYAYSNLIKWWKIKGKYKGKRCFLIANGPSLNITPLYLLKNEYTIMFNRAGLMIERLGYNPNFYMITDNLVIDNIRDEIPFFVKNCSKVFVPDISKNSLLKIRDIVPYEDNVYYMYEEPVKFSHTLPYMNVGGTVIYAAFQVLKYMGFDEVIVVGNDMNYVIHQSTEVLHETSSKGVIYQSVRSKTDDDPNHFDPRYFGKGKEYHQPTSDVVKHIFESLDVVAKEYKKYGVKVINAGYNSAVNSFPKIDFYEVLGYSESKIERMFEELLKSLKFKSIKEFTSYAVRVDDIWHDNIDVVVASEKYAQFLIKLKIIDYLPIGPYKKDIYFINRNLLK